MATTKKPKRGGKRPGAGRKPQHGATMIMVAFKVPSDLKAEFFAWCAERDISPSKVLRWAMREIAEGKWTPAQFRREDE